MRTITLLLFVAILVISGPVVYGASTADFQVQITAILRQVQDLQAQLQGTQPPTLPEKETIVLTFNLRLGSTDAATNGEVTKLQQFLARGDQSIYPEALITGYFGTKTEAAVKRFQSQSGVSAIGVVGPKTREAIKRATMTITPVTAPTVTAAPVPISTSTATSTAATTTATTTVATSAPVISALGNIIVSPSSAQVNEAVTITGLGFTATGNDVYFGAAAIKNLNSFNGGTMITFQIPGEAGTTKIFPGTYSVYVSNANGQTATSTLVVGSGTSYPSIVSIFPSVAKVGETITLSGNGFTVPGNDVHFGVGGRNITTLAKYKGTILTFQVPPAINNCDFSTGLPPCTDKPYLVVPGDYAIYIVNQNGKTNSVKLTVTQY